MSTTKPARLPALPSANTGDATLRAWMQAVAERLEVREGQRGDEAERAVTRRDLEAALKPDASTAPPEDGWWAKYRSIDDLASALRETEMHDDLLRRIAQARGVTDDSVMETSGRASTGAAATTPPSQLRLTRNDLDFYRLPAVSSSHDAVYQEFVCTVNVGDFFRFGGDHLVFAVDCQGSSGNGHPHWGPIIRNGASLFEYARGFIVFGDGRVFAEHWNGTFSPGVAQVASSVPGFNPTNMPIFTVKVAAGYRVGALANHMAVTIHQGGLSGPVVFNGSVPWGWDRTGAHVAYFGAIGPGFISPNSTGNVERGGSGAAPYAYVPFSGAKLSVY